MRTVFISQPVKGQTKVKIMEERAVAIEEIKRILGEDFIISDNLFSTDEVIRKPLWVLGKSFEMLSSADIVYFAKGWNKDRKCRLEYTAAQNYGIKIIKYVEN